MPKLDLTRARQIKGAMGEILSLKGPGYSWVRPPQLADFYGVSPGQIPGDWRLDDPVLAGDGVTITGVRNDGGAGAVFAMGQRGTQPLPRKSGQFADMSGGRQLRLANPVDLVNVHFMAVVDPRNSPTVDAPILAREFWDTQYYLEFRQTHIMLRGDPGAIASVTYPPGAGLGLYEWRWRQGQKPVLYYNGALVGYSGRGDPPDTSFLVQVFAGGVSRSPAQGYTGPAGRCISVIVDPARSPTDLEPAVLVARQTLASQYGIALT